MPAPGGRGSGTGGTPSAEPGPRSQLVVLEAKSCSVITAVVHPAAGPD